MYNPRWPHRLLVFESTLDDDGLPRTDENGDEITDRYLADVWGRRLRESNGLYLTVPGGPMQIESVVYDSRLNPVMGADGKPRTETIFEVPWGYRTSTGGMRDSGEVFHTDFKISTPMITTQLEEGMLLLLTDYTHTFVGVVKKMTTYNWGTNIWFDRYGNEGSVPTS